VDRFPLSDVAIDALSGLPRKLVDELCTDPFWNPKLRVCEDYDPLQPASCLLRAEERPVGTVCCRERSFTAITEASDWSKSRSSGSCAVLSDAVRITYHDCRKPDGSPAPAETYAYGGISANCSADMKFTINVIPSKINLFACDTRSLKATITGYAADGTVMILAQEFPVKWTSLSPAIAALDTSGVVTGLIEGVAVVIAETAVRDARITPGEAVVNVSSNIRSFTVTPSQNTIEIGDAPILTAEVVGQDGALLDASNVIWSSSNRSIAHLIPETGASISVNGRKEGSVIITANYQFECETISATAQIVVVCSNRSFKVGPTPIKLNVGEERMLVAEVFDKDGNALDASGVTWIVSGDSVDLMWNTGSLNRATGIRPGRAEIIAKYYDGCRIQEEIVLVNVECVELMITPSSGNVKMDASLPLSADVLDDQGNPINVDLSGITWSSNNPGIALVKPSVGSQIEAVGISPGLVEITATYTDTCGTHTATAALAVELDLTGTWQVRITSVDDNCPWDEEEIETFNINITQSGDMLSAEFPDITATGKISNYYPPAGSTVNGPWTISYGLHTSSETEDCLEFFADPEGWLWGGYDDPENECTGIFCEETARMEGIISEDGRTITGVEYWTFAYEAECIWSRGDESEQYGVAQSCEGIYYFVATKQ